MNEVSKDILIIALAFGLGIASFWLWQETHKSPIVNPLPSPTPSIIKTPGVVNKPTEILRDPIAKGQIVKEIGTIVIKDNDKPITVVVPPVNVQSKDTNVIVKPGQNNQTETKEVVVPTGGGTIQLPEQNWNIKIDREYSPFRVDLFGLPEPSLGLGYDLVTVSLDNPLGLKLNFGNLSAGPFVAKSMLNDNFYVGGELSKGLGRVNANIGYGWLVQTGEGKLMAGISFNFK